MIPIRRASLPWLPPALGGAAVAVAVLVYWHGTAEFVDRILVVAAASWLLGRARAGGSAPGVAGRLAAVAVVGTSVALATPAWFLVALEGPRPITLWWLAATWVVAALGAAYSYSGWSGVRAIVFPAFFLLFSLPLPHRVEGPVQLILQTATTRTAAATLPVLGVPVACDGFVLRLPGGDLGVIEACSGLKSITALLAIAAFVGHVRGFGVVRGLALLALAVPVTVACNVGRVVVTGLLQEHVGRPAIEGTAHDALGYATVLVGLAIVVGLSHLLRPRQPPAPEAAGPVVPAGRGAGLTAGLITAGLAAGVVAFVVGRRAVEDEHRTAPLEQLARQVGDWQGEDAPIPDDVRAELTCDAIVHRVYRSPVGQEVHAWVIFWASTGSVRGYHHPDVCWPNRGYEAAAPERRPLQLAGGAEIPVAVRRFHRRGDRQVVYYWSQEGNRVWSDAEEEAAHMEGTPGHRWVRERLSGQPLTRSGRLAVLVGGDLWGTGDVAERAAWAFTGEFAAAVYRVAPWAVPPAP